MPIRHLGFLTIAAFFSASAMAHTAQFSCFDEGAGKVLCEGGFSDGSSAAGANVSIVDAQGKALHKGKVDANSEFRFNKPKGAYTVQFDAGPGHTVEIPSKNIVQ